MTARRPSLPAAVLLTAAALFAGCSEGGGGGTKDAPRAPAPADQRSADEQVIRGWSRALAKGDLAAAAGFFAMPSIVSNGTPPVELTTPALAREFNASLPCGGRLEASVRQAPYTVAVFRLTERTGGACGAGTGNRAATAFRIRDGKIVEWRRVEVPPDGPAPEQDEPAPSSPPV